MTASKVVSVAVDFYYLGKLEGTVTWHADGSWTVDNDNLKFILERPVYGFDRQGNRRNFMRDEDPDLFMDNLASQYHNSRMEAVGPYVVKDKPSKSVRPRSKLKSIRHVPTGSENFFANCDRDQDGHCKPEGTGTDPLKPKPPPALPDEPKHPRLRKPRSQFADVQPPPPLPDSEAPTTQAAAPQDQAVARPLLPDDQPESQTNNTTDHPVIYDPAAPPPGVEPAKLAAWHNVLVNGAPDPVLMVVAVNHAGLPVILFDDSDDLESVALQYAKLVDGASSFPVMMAEIQADRNADESKDLADASWLIMEQGIGEQAVTELTGNDVTKTEQGVVQLKYQLFDHIITNIYLSSMLTERKDKVGGGYLFPSLTSDTLLYYVTHLDGGGFTPKDLRMIAANLVATESMGAMQSPQSWDDYQSQVMQVVEVVGRFLGEDPGVVMGNFLSPVLFGFWRASTWKEADDGGSAGTAG